MYVFSLVFMSGVTTHLCGMSDAERSVFLASELGRNLNKYDVNHWSLYIFNYRKLLGHFLSFLVILMENMFE